jgi:hypothetical protein
VWLCRGTCAMIQLAMLATVELMTENIPDISEEKWSEGTMHAARVRDGGEDMCFL